ncbi:MAG: hypothetical protein Q9219_003763 [cf. Caloplaca sp. 3 TL-2023]
MQLTDWLDDLCVRFIINLPQEELESVERICFQVEEAQWYYEDFIRPLDPELPSLSLRNFCLRIFQHCPLLSEFSPYHHAAAFEEFLAYKTRVPVRGAIMLNDEMDQVVLVKGWRKGANWSFPRGKINKDESDLACAIREVYEETGYDVESAGLVKQPEDMKYIDVAIQHQHIRLYVFRGVPMNTMFEARTRKEISKIDWWKLSDLPTLKKKKQQQEGKGEDLAVTANKFYMVAPLLVPLKKWISQQKRMEKTKSTDQLQGFDNKVEELPIEDHGLSGIDAVPASDDMDRLFAGLRQQAQAPITSNSSTSKVMATAGDASSQLKMLLRVPTGDQKVSEKRTSPVVPNQSTSTPAEEKRASTLLALLRGGPATQKAPLPQTPLEQVMAPPSVPETPKPNHQALPHVSALPPPTFPLPKENPTSSSPNGVAKPTVKATASHQVNTHSASIAAWNNFETTSAEQEATKKKTLAEKRVQEAEAGLQSEATLPVMNETWRQVKVGRDMEMRLAGQRQVSNVVKRTIGGGPQSPQSRNERSIQQQAPAKAVQQPVAAPYQATSIAPIATNSQYPDLYRPAIPAANKLPMPKLTAHSSSLLNLFKSDQSTAKRNDNLNASVAAPSLHEQSQIRSEEDSTGFVPSKSASGGTPTQGVRAVKASSPTMQQAVETSQPQSAHQAALLDLFRKSSLSATEPPTTPKATLDIPANLVELSAMPSPSHLKEPSKAYIKEPQKAVSPAIGGRPSIHKHQPGNARDKKPPVFATVNGPLNVPHFDTIAAKAKNSGRKPTAEKEVKKSPITILARPARPSQEPHIQPPQPPAPKRETPSPLSASERHHPLKADHKATLLSLFTKSSTPSPGPDLSAFVSPVAAKAPVSFPLPSKNTNHGLDHAARPRSGTSHAELRDGVGVDAHKDSIGSEGVKRTTKKTTSDVDRTFLLGYLEGVAKKEGK